MARDLESQLAAVDRVAQVGVYSILDTTLQLLLVLSRALVSARGARAWHVYPGSVATLYCSATLFSIQV